MTDDWAEVGEITDGSGKKIAVAWAQGKVRFAVKAPVRGLHLTTIVLDGPARDEFLRLIARAESQAEAGAAREDDGIDPPAERRATEGETA